MADQSISMSEEDSSGGDDEPMESVESMEPMEPIESQSSPVRAVLAALATLVVPSPPASPAASPPPPPPWPPSSSSSSSSAPSSPTVPLSRKRKTPVIAAESDAADATVSDYGSSSDEETSKEAKKRLRKEAKAQRKLDRQERREAKKVKRQRKAKRQRRHAAKESSKSSEKGTAKERSKIERAADRKIVKRKQADANKVLVARTVVTRDLAHVVPWALHTKDPKEFRKQCKAILETNGMVHVSLAVTESQLCEFARLFREMYLKLTHGKVDTQLSATALKEFLTFAQKLGINKGGPGPDRGECDGPSMANAALTWYTAKREHPDVQDPDVAAEFKQLFEGMYALMQRVSTSKKVLAPAREALNSIIDVARDKLRAFVQKTGISKDEYAVRQPGVDPWDKDNRGIGHSAALWYMRQAAMPALQAALGHSPSHPVGMSMDGFAFRFVPSSIEDPTIKGSTQLPHTDDQCWFHRDAPPNVESFQAVVHARPTNASADAKDGEQNTTTITYFPGSHLASVHALLFPDAKPRCSSHFLPMGTHDQSVQDALSKMPAPVAVLVDEGMLTIFNSSTVHCTAAPRGNGQEADWRARRALKDDDIAGMSRLSVYLNVSPMKLSQFDAVDATQSRLKNLHARGAQSNHDAAQEWETRRRGTGEVVQVNPTPKSHRAARSAAGLAGVGLTTRQLVTQFPGLVGKLGLSPASITALTGLVCTAELPDGPHVPVPTGATFVENPPASPKPPRVI